MDGSGYVSRLPPSSASPFASPSIARLDRPAREMACGFVKPEHDTPQQSPTEWNQHQLNTVQQVLLVAAAFRVAIASTACLRRSSIAIMSSISSSAGARAWVAGGRGRARGLASERTQNSDPSPIHSTAKKGAAYLGSRRHRRQCLRAKRSSSPHRLGSKTNRKRDEWCVLHRSGTALPF